MKAVYVPNYGSSEVIEVRDVPKPEVSPKDVLVLIYASSVSTAHGMMRSGTPKFARLFLGISRPSQPLIGTGFAGVVEQVGSEVSKFSVGDEVMGTTDIKGGANAEYVSISEDDLILPKPKNVSFEAAAVMDDGPMTSMNFLTRITQVKAGQTVLINGASGGLGSVAVEIAKHKGAYVIGVCSGKNVEFVKSLGADKVIDYTKDDFTRTSDTYDIIYDTIGKSSYSACKQSLTKNGIYCSPVLSLGLLIKIGWHSLFSTGKRAWFSATGLLPIDQKLVLAVATSKMMEEGKINPHIEATYDFDHIRDAHAVIDTGRKVGNLVLVSFKAPTPEADGSTTNL
jgi:NADPH:quinone reductase-like Zn-dependent oxidoreductase